MSHNHHPNVHNAAQEWSNDQTLHIATAYNNPLRWNSRRELMNDFIQHMNATKNVKLHVGELAYGDRPFEVTGTGHDTPVEVQFRSHAELFHKENVLNETIKRFDPDWKYGGYCDGDFTMTRPDWAIEAIHLLQHFDWVQLFSTYTDLSDVTYGGSNPGRIVKSFARTYVDNGHALPAGVDPSGHGLQYGYDTWPGVGATGGAWAFRRSAFETVGGLLDQAILGHADWFMAFGLVSETTQGTIASRAYHPHYKAAVAGWQNKAVLLKKNIGCVDQFAVHHYHGPKRARGYDTRDLILVKHQFDPVADLRRNAQGIWELTGNKPGMRDAIRRYFHSRKEDNTEE